MTTATPSLPTSGGSDFDLDALLAESMTDAKAAADTKVARQILAKGGLPTAERDAIAASVRAFELRREWNPAAAVVMFSRQKCKGCGGFSTQFTGYYQRQTHRHTGISRWVPHIPPTDEKLPREAKYVDTLAESCTTCAWNAGFDVEED